MPHLTPRRAYPFPQLLGLPRLPLGGSGGWAERLYPLPLLILIWLLFTRASFPLDDAYITLHNARSLLAGGDDPVYVGTNALAGATSAVHLVLVAGLGAIVPLALASKLASLIGLLLYAAGLATLLRRLGCPPAARLALFTGGMLLGYMPYHLLNGLESGLAVAAMVWAFVLADSRWLPLLCGTLPFIRPELAFLSLPLMVRHVWLLRAEPRRVLAAGALAFAGAAPWMLLTLAFTGALLPNTGAAKVFFFGEASRPLGFRIDVIGLIVRMSQIGPFFLGFVGLWKTSLGRCALVFVAGWLTVALVTLPGGLTHNWYRYCSMLLPVLLLGWATILALPATWHRAATAILGVWAVVTGLAAGVDRYLVSYTDGTQERIAASVARSVPRDAMIMIHDAGYIAWTLPGHKMVDVVRLKSSDHVGWRTALTSNPESRSRAVAEIAARSGARYFVVLAHAPFWGTLVDDLKRHGWQLQPIDDGKPAAYALYRITPPEPKEAR